MLKTLEVSQRFNMPHDANGVLLEVGDEVTLHGKVKSIDSEQPTFCNITVKCDRGMDPTQDGADNENAYTLVLSARMVEKESST
jgi:uncharacterized Zn ribbon protein